MLAAFGDIFSTVAASATDKPSK
ncbi:MAG: hypothetical protein RI933_375, partial [Actinomycetota bacterium]